MRETVLITGASSGIGWELAKLFAADGSRLVLVARREERLQQLANELKEKYQTESIIVPIDLSKPESPRRLFDDLQARNVQVDVLVNNAGFGQLGKFADISLELQLKMIDLNISAVVHLTHLFVQGMRERKRGAILNLGSTAAFQPGPNSAVYYATKAFVLSFSEALWDELRKTGVSVTCLCPGPTKTAFPENSHMQQTFLFKYASMSAKRVARAGHRAVRKRKRLVIPGMFNRSLTNSVRFGSRRLVLRIMSRLQASRGKDRASTRAKLNSSQGENGKA